MLEDLPELILSMKTGVNRIRNISSSMRTFSRSDTTQKVVFDIHEGIDSTLLILKHRLKANEHRPEIEVIKNEGSLPPIKCYPGQLNQVFMNILANAIDVFDEMSQLRGNSQSLNLENFYKIWIDTRFLPENKVIEIRIKDNDSSAWSAGGESSNNILSYSLEVEGEGVESLDFSLNKGQFCNYTEDYKLGEREYYGNT